MGTPYNTIYETMNNGRPPCEGESCGENIVCCAHGGKCETALRLTKTIDDGSEDEDGQYANLVDEKQMDATKKIKDVFAKNPSENFKAGKNKKKKSRISQIPSIQAIVPKKTSTINNGKKNRHSEESSTDSEMGFPAKAKEDNASEALYIGVRTFAEAEAVLQGDTEFLLYHRIQSRNNIDELGESANLHLVYRMNSGEFRHYPVMQRHLEDGRIFVDYGNPRAESQENLDGLVRFYKENSRILKNNADIGSMKY